MAELELQQVKCPSCKRVISSFSPFQAMVECPYCHNKAFNPLITAKKVPVPERIIKLSLTENSFEKKLVDHLVKTDYVPGDIFEHLTADKIFKAYLPMYLFEGVQDTTVYWEEKKSIEGNDVYLPVSKPLKKSFAVMSLAYEGDEIPPELSDFARWFDYDATHSREYEPALLGLTGGADDPITLAINTDKEIIWAQYVKKTLIKKLEDYLRKKYNGKNWQYDDPAYSIQSRRYVLAPVWFVYYSYNNEKFHFIMDGTGKKESITYPVNNEEKKYVSRMEGWGVALAFLCAAFCFFVKTGNFFTWLLLVILPAIAILSAFYIPASRRKKKSRVQREEGAKRLLGE